MEFNDIERAPPKLENDFMDELRQMQGKTNVRVPKIQQHPDLTDETDFEQKRYE